MLAPSGCPRMIPCSTTTSVGPPIRIRCSILSRLTRTRRLRVSMLAASMIAMRGCRPRVVLIRAPVSFFSMKKNRATRAKTTPRDTTKLAARATPSPTPNVLEIHSYIKTSSAARCIEPAVLPCRAGRVCSSCEPSATYESLLSVKLTECGKICPPRSAQELRFAKEVPRIRAVKTPFGCLRGIR